jgi:hypothetical protein
VYIHLVHGIVKPMRNFIVLLRTLGDEKSLLYESLCEQTEKLEACRNQLESTRQLLLQKVKQMCLNSKNVMLD